MHRLFLYFLFLILPVTLFAEDISYDVHFECVDQEDDEEILCILKSASELIILKDSPPATITALRRRAEADISNLVRGLHGLGYYNAKIQLNINSDKCPAEIIFTINLGPIYPLSSFVILPYKDENEEKECDFPYDLIKLKHLCIEIGDPALPKTIIAAENNLLNYMTKKGYPLATIKKRSVVANQATKAIEVTLYVDSGPLTYFGGTTISGLDRVEECVIRKKISWQFGEQFNPECVDRTLNDIESSGLFSSVNINYPEEPVNECYLPISIEVIECKHRTIGGGIGYNTQVGPGVIALWEHRNMRGLGEKLSFKADVSFKKQNGTLLYRQPDFLCYKQDLYWITEFESEQTKGYNDTAFSFSGIIDRDITEHLKISYGGTIKQLHTEHSNNNRQFILLKSPLSFRWCTANNILDPVRGSTLSLKVTPTYQIVEPKITYYINNITGTVYKSLRKDHKLVIAAKACLGSIWGASDINIPPPERFFIGSENTLRGYNYLTVSPLDDQGKPIGGRSMMVYTVETRCRVTETIGIVFFYEIGNVWEQILPQFIRKQRQSTGFGFRYHTPVGPLRFDLAFPLNRRPNIDFPCQFYFSIGQAF